MGLSINNRNQNKSGARFVCFILCFYFTANAVGLHCLPFAGEELMLGVYLAFAWLIHDFLAYYKREEKVCGSIVTCVRRFIFQLQMGD